MRIKSTILVLIFTTVSCGDVGVEQGTEANLLINSTFELGGVPSLHGWVVTDPSAVHFSTDIPANGSGHSVSLRTGSLGDPWTTNSIYSTIVGTGGTHQYRLSFIGKTNELTSFAGGVSVYRNRPSDSNFSSLMSLNISDTVWTSYSSTGTITTTQTDTLFIVMRGIVTEVIWIPSTTLFNTCKFEIVG